MIVMATFSGTPPAAIKLRAAERRRSWNSRSGLPIALVAFPHAPPAGEPQALEVDETLARRGLGEHFDRWHLRGREEAVLPARREAVSAP